MKKLILSFIFISAVSSAFCFSVSNTHTHNTNFWRNSSAAYIPLSRSVYLGAEFDVTEHKNFKNHIYTARLPFVINNRGFILKAVPFALPDNDNGASAYGGKILFSTGLKVDEIEGTSAEGYFSAGVVSQKAGVLENGILTEKDTFVQSAYEVGLSSSFFGVYAFNISGNYYQYHSGLDGVEAVGGVFNQAELADLGTMDYMLGLPKGSAGIKISWRSELSRSDNFISYRYIDMQDLNNRHSLLVNTSLLPNGILGEMATVNLAYNHIFIPNESDLDIFGIGLTIGF